jgi:hypothetical protein
MSINPSDILNDVINSLDSELLLQSSFDQNINETLLIEQQQQPLIPASILIPSIIQGIENDRLLCCLFDTGGSSTIINRRALPKNVNPTKMKIPMKTTTAAGVFQINEMVTIEQSILPEFTKQIKIQTLNAHIFDSPSCHYDIILGRDILNQLKIDILYSNKIIRWLDFEVAMKTKHYWQNAWNMYYTFAQDDNLFESVDSFLREILPSKYEKANIDDVIKKQAQLTLDQQNELHEVLNQFEHLFNGELGFYPHQKIHLELKPDAVPYHAKPYPVPHVYHTLFLAELQRLIDSKVLIKCGASEWAAPTFIIPKKDGRVRWVSDFRKLNDNLKRKIYPLPRIQDILHRRKGYKYFTKLDISMQYYTFELDEDSSYLCIIVTPFGKYRYLRLPMGIKQSPDVAQEIMETTLADLRDFSEVYIDDIGIFSDSWTEHINHLQLILQRLQDNGFTINPLKCEWAVQETDWLGYWLTPHGLKPWSKKIKAIIAMQRPQNMKQLRSFIGAVTYYRDMWPQRSHILDPLTSLTSSPTFIWEEAQQQAFDRMKALMATDALLAYPDHNKPFCIYTDASDVQLGSYIMQEDKVLAYYSKKLSSAQKNYTTTEKELLSIVMTLQEFQTMLLGAEIHVYTDHKNITCSNLTSQRVLRWRLYLEDFAPTIHYIEGKKNILADAISRLPFDDNTTEIIGPKSTTVDEAFSLEFDDPELFDCLIHYPTYQLNLPYPLDFQTILKQQKQDEQLRQLYQHDARYNITEVAPNINLITYNNRIFIPRAQLEHMVCWYHLHLQHAGLTCLFQTISMHFYHPQLHRTISNIVRTCDSCQRYKKPQPGYGQLPIRQVTMQPWSNIAVDLIGPWKITINNIQFQLRALTAIDTDTNLADACLIDHNNSGHIAMKFHNLWLSRYPKPNRCIHDNGGEFTGPEFQAMLQYFNIHDTPTTVLNPTANAICERMHQTVANSIRTSIYEHHPTSYEEFYDIVETALAAAIYALRTTINISLNTTPGALTFHRDMLLDIPIHADLQRIQQHRQQLVNRNAYRHNLHRHQHTYHINDLVLILQDNPSKLEARYHGPYTILQVHNNGTVTLQRHPNITECINIRRIKPYYN